MGKLFQPHNEPMASDAQHMAGHMTATRKTTGHVTASRPVVGDCRRSAGPIKKKRKNCFIFAAAICVH